MTRKYLIIGGMPKAGSTSIFNWLASHPAFMPAKMKETRFFLDADYPLPRGQRFSGNNIEEYFRLFANDSDDKIFLESSPDYLYCRTPLALADMLPNSYFLFVVRDPVERAISWYKFAAQLGYLAKSMSFEEYINAQLGSIVTQSTPIYMRALDQNRLNKYLPKYKNAFGSRCLVLNFEELVAEPRDVMRKVCSFIGVDSTFYDQYLFEAKNISTGIHASRAVRLYYRSRAWVKYNLEMSPSLTKHLRPLASLVKRSLSGSQRVRPIQISEELKERIREDALLLI